MATPAAVLSILVKADTASATSSLSKFDSRLRGVDKTAAGATTRTSALGSATKTTGARLASAARWAAGAAAAYVSIAQAKAAVSTTQELAATSGALSRNLGLATKQASRWASVAQTRDIDTKTMNASFATLTKNVVAVKNAARGTTAAFEELGITQGELAAGGSVLAAATRRAFTSTTEHRHALVELGIEQKALQKSDGALARAMQESLNSTTEDVSAQQEAFATLGITTKDLEETGGNFNKVIRLVAEGFGKAEGGAERQAAAQTLLGRGYQTLLPLMAEGSKALQKQLELGDQYGATLRKVDVTAQGELAATLRESQRAYQGLQVTFATALTPALIVLNEQFQEAARIMADPNLTDDEKFRKIAEILQKDFTKALDVMVAMIPTFAEHIGEAAPKIAGALVKGFLHADALGKLFLGGWFLKALGGGAAIRAIGAKIGGWIAGQVAARMAAATIAEQVAGNIMGGASKSKWSGLGSKIGGLIGPLMGIAMAALAAKFLWDHRKEILEIAKKIAEEVKDIIGNVTDEVFQKVKVGEGLAPAVSAWMQDFADAGDDLTKTQARQFKQQLHNLREHGKVTKQEYTGMLDVIRDRTGKAEESSTRNFWQAAERGDAATKRLKGSVSDNIASLANAVAGGMKNIRDNTNKSLQAFGVKKLAFNIESVGKAVAGLKQGGTLVPGTGAGDKVPLHLGGQLAAMVEPGELVSVANRTATADLMRHNSRVPRKAGGGIVGGGLNFALGPYDIPPIRYAADHAGGNSHVHITGTTTPWVVALGRKLQQMGFMVSEHPAFGGVNFQHSATGGHYDALAIDVNSAADETRAEVASIARLLGGAGGLGAAVEMVKRVLLEGPAGPLKDMGQSALDKSRKAATAYIAKKMPMGIAPVDAPGGILSGPEIQSLWRRSNPDLRSVAHQMAMKALGESSGNPRAIGHDPGGSIGYGLWQITTPFNDDLIQKYGGVSKMLTAGPNALAAGDVFRRQGIGAWYAPSISFGKGGALPSLDTGGRVTQGGLAEVHPGDVHRGGNGPMVLELHLHGSMDAVLDEVDALVDGRKPEIAEYVIREGGRGLGRARQRPGKAGRA